jgi:hypothetical protein
MVSISCANAGSSNATGFEILVNGTTIATTYIVQAIGAGNFFTTLSVIVPNGATYNAAGGVSITLSRWSELR